MVFTEEQICRHVNTQHNFISEMRPPVIWMGKTTCGQVEIWVDGLWMDKK